MIAVLKMLDSLELSESDLRDEKNSALQSWIRKYTLSNPGMSKQELTSLIKLYPYKIARIIFGYLNTVAGTGLTSRCIAFICKRHYILMLVYLQNENHFNG